MMKYKVLGTAAIAMGVSCGAALAQTPTLPDGPAPQTAPDAVRPVEGPATVAPGVGAAPARPPNDPNTTGPDKVNGLEVPQMKGEPPAAR